MAGIRWMCLSDLHLGALNSLLTPVDVDGERVDPGKVSPVVPALSEALSTLCTGDEPAELIVLGDLFDLALGTAADAGVTFAQFITALRPAGREAVVGPRIRYVPGNHDHHLWTRARGASFIDHIRGLPATEPLPYEAHATHLLPEEDPYPVRDTLIELLARRAASSAQIVVEQSYPNFGVVAPGGRRAVVFSHGHFIEPLYRVMSTLEDFRQNRPPDPMAPEDLEAENGAWIDFFWSSMGDSGGLGRWARKLYESLQSDEAVEAEIEAIRRGFSRRPRSRIRGHLEGLLVDGGLTTAVKRSMRRERHEPDVLSDKGRSGLIAYLSEAVARQMRDERWTPTEVAFVFGHTHKPFVETEASTGLPGPGTVINTGGWVADEVEPEEHKGAAVILLDDDLNVAVVRCFGKGTRDGHGVIVEGPPDDAENPLVKQVADHVAAADGVWEALAEATAATERLRCDQLRARLDAQTDELEPTEGS